MERKYLFLYIIPILVFLFLIKIAFPSCVYTEKEIDTPQELAGITLYLENDVWVATGKNNLYKDKCTTTMYNIENSIMDSEAKEYEDYILDFHGQTLVKLNKGENFTLEKVIAVTKHGITNIDSGPGPIHYLVLRNSENKYYVVATVWLEEGEVYLTSKDNKIPINWMSLYDNYGW